MKTPGSQTPEDITKDIESSDVESNENTDIEKETLIEDDESDSTKFEPDSMEDNKAQNAEHKEHKDGKKSNTFSTQSCRI